jgi:hypothetical protein
MPFVRIDPARPHDFTLEGGEQYVPLGGNIPWLMDPGDRLSQRLRPFYRERFSQLASAGLNWVRIWMVHWSRLNLDWLEEDRAVQPAPGWLSSDVAGNWDAILKAAEANRVYVQMVLQHHGQYSTETNPKWDFNPWNAANEGGFLERPAEFFTSPKARQLTRQKYRYIVARWGYSPAVMAWELFNEVHWVDALRFEFDEKAVAEWHAEMADYLRSVDAHGHLVTTSAESIRSPVYDRMDYLQPHIYAVDMLSNVRYIDPAYHEIGKPAFYGEFGDDHMPLTDEQKASGVSIVPPVWAGLMGPLRIPPQTWFLDRLIETGHLGKLATIATFVEATGLGVRGDLLPFSPAVDGPGEIPLVLRPGFVWMNRPNLAVDVATDGSEPVSLALVPGVLTADPIASLRGFAESVTFRTDFFRPDTVRVTVRLGERSAGGTTVTARVGDRLLARHTWAGPDKPGQVSRKTELEFLVPQGPQTVVLRNVGGPGWFHVDGVHTGFNVPLLAAVGKRADDLVALWIWHRTGIFSMEAVEPATATLELEEVPGGTWTTEWWDTETGIRTSMDPVVHEGGALRIETLPVRSHAAIVLRRSTEPT